MKQVVNLLRNKKGFEPITLTIILAVFFLIVWLVWVWAVKPVYHFLTGHKEPAIEMVHNPQANNEPEELEQVKNDPLLTNQPVMPGNKEKEIPDEQNGEEDFSEEIPSYLQLDDPEIATFKGKMKHPFKYTSSWFGKKKKEERLKEWKTNQKITKQVAKCFELFNEQNYQKASTACKEALISSVKNGKNTYELHAVQGKILTALADYESARQELARALATATNPQQMQESKELFAGTEILFKNNFLTRKYEDRKFIVPIEDVKYISKFNYIIPFEQNHLPEVTFPTGHPVVNQLYIAHPYIEGKYVPFAEADRIFLKERAREFCELAQALGATELSLKSQQISHSKKQTSSEQNRVAEVDGDGIVKTVLGSTEAAAEVTETGSKFNLKAGVDSSRKSTEELVDMAFSGIDIHQTFGPSDSISCPKNLVWYPHEKDWQHLCNQRLKGNLKSHRERMESRSKSLIQKSEIGRIKGDLDVLARIGGIDWDKTQEQTLERLSESIMEVDISFEPEAAQAQPSSQTPQTQTPEMSSLKLETEKIPQIP